MIAATALLVLTIMFVSLIARRRAFAGRVLIIGNSPLARQLVTEFTAHRHVCHRLTAVVDDPSETDAAGGPVRSSPSARLGPIIEEIHPDRIVVALADRRGRLPMRELLDATVDGVVVEDGVWHDVRSCWFNGLYTRVVPSHAVELTAALLDRGVADTVGRQRSATAALQQKQDLAAVIHLCGAGPGDDYARRGFRLTAGQRCGDHDVSGYLARVNELKRLFLRLAAAG